jgi:prepilin-type N-terminal cleavage/methylation domain-containing protein
MHKQMHTFKQGLRKQKGFSLMEIAIAIVVVSVLMFGVFYLVSVTNARSVTKEEIEHLQSMAADVRTKFRQQGSYADVTPEVMIDLGIVPPAKLNADPRAITTGWSTTVDVAVSQLLQQNDAIAFIYDGVPRTSCADFVDGGAGTASRVDVDGTIVKDVTQGAESAFLNTVELASACQATAGDNVSITFTYGR